jgi:hypothetical protein
MKKSLFTSLFAPVFVGFVLMLGLIAGPAMATAQAYYGNFSTYSSAQPYNGCVSLTVSQGLGSTDAITDGQVSMLQVFLNQAGYLSGVSGTFDNGTYGAVVNYQRAYGLPITGIADPATRSLINQRSCTGLQTGYPGSYQVSYPVTNYSNGNNCYWTGGAYTSTYVCTNQSIVPLAPVVPVYPYSPSCTNYGSNYNNYGNNYNNNNQWNNCNPYGVVLNSLSASYTYSGATITVTGYGFSNSGNTVYFGNTLISSNVYSSNGTTLTFTVPAGYYTGTYGITVKNSAGYTSNSLSFTMNNNTSCNNNTNWNYGYQNNNCYNNSNWNTWNNSNNGYYGNENNGYSNPVLSSISGPTNVQTGMMNTWSVSSYGSNSGYVTLRANWGDDSTSVSDRSANGSNYGSQNYTFSHEYSSPGIYTLVITATSNNGQVVTSNYTITVTGNRQYNW